MIAVEFARLWALALLPLPLAAWMLMPAAPERRAMQVPAGVMDLLRASADAEAATLLRPPARMVVLIIGWMALVLALAGPRIAGEILVKPTGRDLVLAIDLSASMAETDIASADGETQRFDIVRAVAQDFLGQRQGDRVGLIGFGSDAFLIAPLTFDTGAVAGMLDQMTIGLPGRKTDLGQAIGLTIKTLADEPVGERLLVILSDGETNTGVLNATDAAALALENGIKIHTIGFAATLNDDGVAAMATIAEATGGHYFAATSAEGLVEVYRSIQAMAPVSADEAENRLMRDVSPVPLFAALLCLGLIGWRELRA